MYVSAGRHGAEEGSQPKFDLQNFGNQFTFYKKEAELEAQQAGPSLQNTIQKDKLKLMEGMNSLRFCNLDPRKSSATSKHMSISKSMENLAFLQESTTKSDQKQKKSTFGAEKALTQKKSLNRQEDLSVAFPVAPQAESANKFSRQMIADTMRKNSNTDYFKFQKQDARQDPSFTALSFVKDITKYRQDLLQNPYFENVFNDKDFIQKMDVQYKRVFTPFDKAFKTFQEFIGLINKRYKIITRSKKYVDYLKELNTKSIGKKTAFDIFVKSYCNLEQLEKQHLLPNINRNNKSFLLEEPSPPSNADVKPRISAFSVQPVEHKIRRCSSDSQLVKNYLNEKIYNMKTNPASIDDFLVVKQLGEGGYGKVLLVLQKSTNDFYAMKMIRFPQELSKKFVETLQNEISVLSLIKGRYLAKAYYSFVEKDCLFIVMEYLVGGDFRAYLEQEGYFDFPIVQFYIAELVLALEELHKTMVHRDLKPENLLIDENGHLKLADFGLSEVHKKMQKLNGVNTSVFASKKNKKGTIDYLPPEILFGDLQ